MSSRNSYMFMSKLWFICLSHHISTLCACCLDDPYHGQHSHLHCLCHNRCIERLSWVFINHLSSTQSMKYWASRQIMLILPKKYPDQSSQREDGPNFIHDQSVLGRQQIETWAISSALMWSKPHNWNACTICIPSFCYFVHLHYPRSCYINDKLM